MAYENLKQLMIARRAAVANTSLEQPLRGTGMLPQGKYAAKILAIDTVMLESRGVIDIVLSTGTEQTQRYRQYVLNFSRDGLNYKFVKFIETLFGSRAVAQEWIELLSETNEALQILRGMTIGVHVSPTEGYALSLMADGYSVINAVTSVPYITGLETAQDAATYAQEHNLQKSSLKISEVYSVATSSNCSAFRRAKASLAGTETPDTDDNN